MRPLTSREPGAAAARAALVAVMLVVGAATAVLGDSQLIAEVSWKAPGGQTGTVLFQGTGDGGVLRGIVYAGDTQLPVTGTIGADGAVSGTVSFGDGVTERIVGTFSAALDMQRHLQGSYLLFRTASTWTAPADKLLASPIATAPDVSVASNGARCGRTGLCPPVPMR